MTALIGLRTIGAGGGYDNAQAVAAVNVWRNWHAFANAAPVVLGAAPVTLASVTFNVPEAGVYRFFPFASVTADSANSLVRLEIFLDGAPRGSVLFSFGVANAVQGFTGAPYEGPLAVGNHTVRLDGSQPASPGVVTALVSSIQAERVQ